jgi:hypothetical protein
LTLRRAGLDDAIELIDASPLAKPTAGMRRDGGQAAGVTQLTLTS